MYLRNDPYFFSKEHVAALTHLLTAIRFGFGIMI
jgi:hypothetical protein